MPRRIQAGSSGVVFHVINRAVRGATLFEAPSDYEAFQQILSDAQNRTGLRLLAFCLMPNHWHLVVWPTDDVQLAKCMHWLTLTHAARWTSFHEIRGTGAVYQSRYKSIPVETESCFLSVCRYVERNPLRAGLVTRAEQWKWSSLWQRCNSCEAISLDEWPIPRTGDWIERVNEPQTGPELEAIRKAVQTGRPLGANLWREQTCKSFGLSSRSRGRPEKMKAPDTGAMEHLFDTEPEK